MKRINLILLPMLLIPFLFLCCATVDESGSDAAVLPSASTGGAAKAFPASGWSYETEITKEGSRSEGSVSRLFYRYNELPPAFNRIVINGHAFTYVPMLNIWDNSGYIYTGMTGLPSEDKISGTINRAELKNGWYQAEPGIQKKGTPSDWVLAESDLIDVRVSPENILDVIELFSLNIIAPPALLPQLNKTGE